MFIYELTEWPDFRWSHEALAELLASVRHQQGRLIGQMEALGFQFREEAVLRTLTQGVLKTSEIEGKILDSDQVRSSLARRLGMDIGGLKPADRDVEGVVEMMLDSSWGPSSVATMITLFASGRIFSGVFALGRCLVTAALALTSPYSLPHSSPGGLLMQSEKICCSSGRRKRSGPPSWLESLDETEQHLPTASL